MKLEKRREEAGKRRGRRRMLCGHLHPVPAEMPSGRGRVLQVLNGDYNPCHLVSHQVKMFTVH